MPEIRMNLKQLKKFLSSILSGKLKKIINEKWVSILEKTLTNKIFVQSLDDIYEVDSTGDMIRYIKAGVGKYIPRGEYNEQYRQLKTKLGEPPHEHGGPPHMKDNVYVNDRGIDVVMYIPMGITTRINVTNSGKIHMYNFFPIHERRKSILKAAMIMSWRELEETVLNTYYEEAIGL